MATTPAVAAERSAYTAPEPAAAPTVLAPSRIASLDIMRGVIMVLMAIDHVRVYSGVPAGGDTAGVFFTRWVTHFCAPGFVFLAGTAAFMHGRKLGDTGALARYLVTRGLMLVVLELTLIRFSWTFNVSYADFVLAGVIWMLGWCMVLLAALVRLSPRTVGWLGVGIICFQQVFHFLPRALPAGIRNPVGRVYEFIYPAGLDGMPGIAILYVLVPWIGVMAAGYGFGAIMVLEPGARRRLCLRIGLSATALFLVLGSIAVVVQGTPSPDAAGGASSGGPPMLFRLLNQQKYPASQLFLLMTLGPMIALLPFAERARGWLAEALAIVGRVPLFYYLLHIPLIHISALLVNQIRTGAAHGEWYASAPFASVPEDQRWPLSLLYLVFVVDVAILYVACRWYAGVKARNPGGWLRYI